MVMGEVEKSDESKRMYRSMGRMFVLCSKAELKEDLGNDLTKIAEDTQRSTEMKVVLDGKKEKLTQALNDLTPKAAAK